MDAEHNGLTLEALAQRLETQAHRLESLEHENAELRHKVSTLEGSDTRRNKLAELGGSDGPREEENASGFEGQVSRRQLLSKVGAAALGAAAAGALMLRDTPEARANHYSGGITVDWVNTHFEAENGVAVLADAPSGTGLLGKGAHRGVKGESTNGAGVVGYSQASDRGAVEATMENASGYGVYGNSWGIGVRGSGGTHGVHGIGTNGYGGLFEGAKAQLRLAPKNTSGPTSGSHSKGEIYMDSAGALFVCVRGGDPATWRKVTTTAV